ncbi:MAG TPA: radical SAM protein [Oligoflexia bacterium]|nr:radical SAM protein [Oligoflexia bacterium]HMP47772.1 radical SAM protein [Oligoflexia bacterium]
MSQEQERNKTLVLVFPPLTMPTSPPLGAAMLKGYIERELPEWSVKVLDLNIWAFDFLFEKVAQGGFLPEEKFPEGLFSEITLKRAAEVFKGKYHDEFYNRPDLYGHYADFFLRFTEFFTQQLAGMAEYCDQNNQIPYFFERCLEIIMNEKPDCIGISMIFSQQLPIGKTIGRLLRQNYKKKVLFGGSIFSDHAASFIKMYPEAADVIVAGEGEDALKQLLQELDSTEIKTPGAVYLKDGEVVKNEGSFRKDIDSFGAPDFSDCNLEKYYSPEPIIPILLSRGCYWRRCTFCVHYRSAGLSYRMHSMDFVIGMIKSFVDKGIRNFAFIDEMISAKHFEILAKAIKEAELNIAYYALAKPVKQFTPELLKMMAESGCKYMLWGLESGTQRILDLMDKGTKIPEVSQLLKDAHDAGIINHVYMICGFPTETEYEYSQTLKFLDDHKDYIYAVHRSVFSLEREAPIFDMSEKFGIKRKWLIREDGMGGRWGYECENGMTAIEAHKAFMNSLPFLRNFNPFAQRLGNFRDHALFIYDKSRALLRPESRNIPKIIYPPPPEETLIITNGLISDSSGNGNKEKTKKNYALPVVSSTDCGN